MTQKRKTYDELGRVKMKKVGNNLQTVDYGYNIKSWLTDINNVSNLATSGHPPHQSHIATLQVSS